MTRGSITHTVRDCARHPKPAAVWPICIRAGAFADAKPIRDLWVSPGHAILHEGVLIQAEKLVNGATIVQLPRDQVEYWHVELDSARP
jgi:Hint domain